MAGTPQAADNPETSSQTVTEATVTLGTVTLDDNSGMWSITPANGIYTDYLVENRYESDHHIYMMPVTSPGGFQGNQVAFCKLAAETILWIADWTAERLGSEPPLPDPDPQDANVILLDEHYEPMMLGLGADGVSVLYRTSGTYVYGFLNPSQAILNHGRPPWLPGVDCTISPGSFQQGIIDCQGSGGGEASPDEGEKEEGA